MSSRLNLSSSAARKVSAPRGRELTCKSWLTAAAYRMIQNKNNPDPDVAEHPRDLVVYGDIGREARNWECFERILAILKRLENDESLLILAFNEMVASGDLEAPIVIGRDHLDSGSVASPNRETESTHDRSDAVSDWPFLNALLNTSSGATRVSIHHGGGVSMGFSQHVGVMIVCDGTPEATKRIGRVLRNDPEPRVMRHADADYDMTIECAKRVGLDLQMLDRSCRAT